MTNTGSPPPHDRVDLTFRNGVTVRDTEPRLWRWSVGDAAYPRDYAWDIAAWWVA